MTHCARRLCAPIACLLLSFVAVAPAAAQTPSQTVAAKHTPARRLRFSGFDWTVKASDQPVGPGPNFFSDSKENVWVDDHGYLHLRITYRDGRWWSAEVICECSLGFGTYAFHIPAETIRDLDAGAVLGLFNWSDEATADSDFTRAHREIDFELSTWGQKKNATGNAQFVLQPYDQPGHISRFNLEASAPAVLSYAWLPTRVRFKAVSASSQAIHDFEFRADLSSPGGNPHMNLWLLGQEPRDGKDIHIIVESFSFQAP